MSTRLHYATLDMFQNNAQGFLDFCYAMTMFGSQQIMEEFIIPLTGVIIGQYINLQFLTLEVQKLMVIYRLLTLKME